MYMIRETGYGPEYIESTDGQADVYKYEPIRVYIPPPTSIGYHIIFYGTLLDW